MESENDSDEESPNLNEKKQLYIYNMDVVSEIKVLEEDLENVKRK